MKKQRIYKTARELFGVVDTGVKVYLCPKFLDAFAEELRKRAAASASTRHDQLDAELPARDLSPAAGRTPRPCSRQRKGPPEGGHGK